MNAEGGHEIGIGRMIRAVFGRFASMRSPPYHTSGVKALLHLAAFLCELLDFVQGRRGVAVIDMLVGLWSHRMFAPISATCQLDRYLEMAFWTMETMGQPLQDAVASTVRWREDAGPHLLTDPQVTRRLDAPIKLGMAVIVGL